jgi:hypothetical protein
MVWTIISMILSQHDFKFSTVVVFFFFDFQIKRSMAIAKEELLVAIYKCKRKKTKENEQNNAK